MSNKQVKIMIFSSYMATVENSVGTGMFRNLYAMVDKKTKDITENGNLSCAYYVSSVLFIFKLISGIHATVEGTEKDIINNGWEKVEQPQKGNILIWEEKIKGKDKKPHKHIGFFIEDNWAISNNDEKGLPVKHHYTYNQTRKIEAIYRHIALTRQK